MDYNKSLSARVKRRNKVGFKGESSDAIWVKNNSYCDYKDPVQNHKEADYKRELARKEKLGSGKNRYAIIDGAIHAIGKIKHVMSKRFADNHQKL